MSLGTLDHQQGSRWSWVRKDEEWSRLERDHAPKTTFSKAVYLSLYMAPGILAAIAINVPAVFFGVRDALGVEGKYLQLYYVFALTFGWHMIFPVLVLRFHERMSWSDVFAYIGLNRFDGRSMFVFMPIVFILFTLISIPYMKWVYPLIHDWVNSVPWMQIPAWSIFQSGPDNLYSFSPVLLLLLFVGNFVGEEVYFRGYLFKKTAFLGRYNWFVNSALFTIYHLWQIPQTWPLIGICFVFGVFMQMRKDMWSVIVLHLLINLAWPAILGPVLARLP